MEYMECMEYTNPHQMKWPFPEYENSWPTVMESVKCAIFACSGRVEENEVAKLYLSDYTSHPRLYPIYACLGCRNALRIELVKLDDRLSTLSEFAREPAIITWRAHSTR